MSRRIIEMIGRHFSRLLVVAEAGRNRKEVQWRCRCDCGKESVIPGYRLRSGHTRSCGCLGRHGMSHTREYGTWGNMIDRCERASHASSAYYSERGIRVCERWRSSFEAFYEDMGVHPPGLSLDRIDNDGNYEPGNCRWATSYEQNHNRRNSIVITVSGETRTLSEWIEERKLNACTVRSRIRRGWNLARAVTTPIREYRKVENVRE